MVVTHKSVKEQKKRGFTVKENDPRRKFMTKAQALAANEELKDDSAKIAAFTASLKKARDAGKAVPKAPVAEKLEFGAEELSKEVEKLEYSMRKIRGPGTKEKRAKIQEKIAKLNEKK